MKKIVAITVVVCVAMVVMIAATALADVQKVSLVPWEEYEGRGTGFVIFSNSTNPTNNLHITISLKKGDPEDLGNVLRVWLRYDDGTRPDWRNWNFQWLVDTLTLNAKGSGNFHINMSVPANTTTLWVGLVRMSDNYSVFVSEYDPYAILTFK